MLQSCCPQEQQFSSLVGQLLADIPGHAHSYFAARSAFGLPACAWRCNTQMSRQRHPNDVESFGWLVLGIQLSHTENSLLLVPLMWLGVKEES